MWAPTLGRENIMEDVFIEIYFFNDKTEIQELKSILESANISFTINKKEDTTENYNYSLSVPEDKVDLAISLISDKQIGNQSSDTIENNDTNNKNEIPVRNIVAIIVMAIFACLMILFYNVGTKILANKKSKTYYEKKQIEKELQKKNQEQLEKEKNQNSSIDENETALSESNQYVRHGINLYNSAEEIPLPKNMEILGLRNMCYDDCYVVEPEEIFIEHTDIFYENNSLKIQITPEDYKIYAPFVLKVIVQKKEFSTDLYNDQDYKEHYEKYGIEYTEHFCNYYYEKENLSYSVRLISENNNVCLLERLFTIPSSKEHILISFNEDKNRINPFIHNLYRIKAGEKYILYFPTINYESYLKNDSVILSYRMNSGFRTDNIPFANYKITDSINDMNKFTFSIDNPGDLHIDFYSSEDSIVDYTSVFSFNMEVFESKNNKENFNEVKWQVNSPEGLNIRSRPYGERVAGVIDKTVITQTESTNKLFDDYIDGIYGYWIPVKLSEEELIRKNEDIKVYSSYDETMGWVFSGYCIKQ